jgi:CubicO group peptidase (beta-lactamase class C family)
VTSHRFQKLAGFIEAELAAGSFPGAGVMVACKGERLFARCWGTYCTGTQRANPLAADVLHRLYSFSKGISATVIVLAHQKKLIDYDAPVQAYISEYRGAWKDGTTNSPNPSGANTIRIRNEVTDLVVEAIGLGNGMCFPEGPGYLSRDTRRKDTPPSQHAC